jgi:hypothetical protein
MISFAKIFHSPQAALMAGNSFFLRVINLAMDGFKSDRILIKAIPVEVTISMEKGV